MFQLRYSLNSKNKVSYLYLWYDNSHSNSTKYKHVIFSCLYSRIYTTLCVYYLISLSSLNNFYNETISHYIKK